MAGLGTGAPIVKVYHEKSMILPDVSRVLACLYEKDIEFERHTASYKSLLKLQASSHAPVPFYDGLTFLEDSREICRYIAETYEHRGDPFLLGKDSLERASIEQWLHHEEHAFNPPSRSLFCHLAFPLTEDDDDIDLQKIKLEEVLKVYEQRLGDTEFLAGNKFTLADLVHLPNSHYITESDKFAYLYDSRKNVQRWWNTISIRKSWQNVLKDIQVVEQQRKQEEFEKQQRRQWLREHPPPTRRQIRLDSRKHASTKSQTILVPPPVGIVSTSPMASQVEKPLPTETSSDETLLSTPTAHKSSAVQSKHTTVFSTHQETPPATVQSTPRLPGYPHTPVQSTSNSFTPATSPTTVEKLSRKGADIPDNAATNADTQDEKSVRYTDHTSQRPAETIYSRSTDQRVTYTSPGKHGSTEAHQKLQTEQWHDIAAGLSNLKGETDYLVPTQQVKPGKDVQHSSSQDSEQVSTHPPDQEPVGMDRQLDQGPEMTPRTPYTDQKRDVSSMPWRQAADVRGIAEEDKASSDHRDAVLPPYSRKHAEEAKIASADHRKDASALKRVKYEVAHDIAQEARETASAPRRSRGQDAYDTFRVIETYHSSSSRAQPINAPQDAASPPKQAASEGPAAQEFIKQARESPASRSAAPRDVQGSTEEGTVESSPSKAHLLDSHLADARPPKKFLDEDGYGSVASLQTGYADDPYNRKRDRDTAAPKRMMSQDAFEETKMTDSASFEAQPFDHQRADAPLQKQQPAEDPQTTASPLKKRYSGGEDTTEQSKPSASRPRRMAAQEIQDNFQETKAGDFRSTRERPSDSWRAPAPLPRHEADDVRSTTTPSQKSYPGTRGTIKEVEDITSMPRRMAGEDADETLEETKFPESASSQAQPLYYHRTDASSRKQEATEDRLGATSPLERRYADAEDTTKHSRDTSFKPSKIVGQDAEDISEEAEARNSALFRAQPQDAQRVAPTPSKQAAEDALSVSPSSPKRYPRAEETRKQPRAAASKPTHIAAQDTRDVFRESKVADSTSSIEQPSDARAAASFQKQEVPDARNTSASFQKRDPDVKGATKKSKVTFEETKSPDSASSQVQPSDSQRDYAPSWKKEATEAPRATTPFKKRDSNIEDTAKHSDGAFKPRRMVGQDTEGTYEDTTTRPRGTASAPRRTTAGDASGAFQESKPADSVSSREQPLSARQPVVTPRKETEDSLSKISAFHKTRPFVEDSTRPDVDTVFGPRQIGAEDTKDITEETKVADSASPVRARPTYTPRTARPLSEQAEVEEDARDKDREGRETISAPKKMVSRDGELAYGERKIPHSVPREQSLDNLQVSSPLKQAAAEDPLGANRGAKESLVDETKHSQGVKGSVGTFEETKDPASALPTAQPLNAQDAQHTDRSSRTPTADQRKDASTPQKGLGSSPSQAEAGDEDQAIMDEKVFSSEQPRKILKESRSTSSRAQPADSRSPTKVERAPSVYQEDHLVAPDSREQPQILRTGVRADHSTPKRQQAPVVPPPTPPRAEVYDDQEPLKRDTVDDPKGDSGTFQESKPADSVPSREQALSSRQPVVTPSRQETEDPLSKISAFHKTRPFVEDITRPAVDTVSGPRQTGAEDTKDITQETKVTDSASSVRARPTYTPRTARPLSEQAEVEEDAREKDREGRQTISVPKSTVSRDAEDTYGERKTPHSRSTEQSLDNLQASSPIKKAETEDPRGATRGDKYQAAKGPVSTLPTAQPLSAQDDQRTDRSSRTPTADQRKDGSAEPQSNNQDTYKEAWSSPAHQKGLGSSPSQAEAGDDDQAIIDEKVFPSEQLRKMPKESRSASSKEQPADSRSPTKVERTPSVYQEDHLVTPDSHEQPKTLPTGVREDGSTPKRQQAPVVPSTSEEKSTPPTPPRAKVHDDHTTEEQFKRDTVDDPKGAPLPLGQEPTPRVQHATKLTPDGDMSSKPSTIDQWQRTSAPMQGITATSGNDVPDVSTIDQKPTPMSQQPIPSARGAKEVVKREQRTVPSAPAGAQTPDVHHAPPSFTGADMAERDGEPVKMQAPSLHARPTSVPTRRETPDSRDTGDNEFANASDAQRWKALKAKHDSAMINEDVNVRPTSGDELVERISRDQGARPPESTKAQTPLDAPRDSVSTQGVPSDALDKTKFAKPSSTEGMTPTAGPASALEAHLAEHKAPSDKKSARAARPLSSGESRKEDTGFSAADQTKKPQTLFHQQSMPSTPITKQVPSSNADHDKRKIQQVTFDNLPTDDSPTQDVPSYEQVSHEPQTIPSERDMAPAPGTSDSPASNTQIASAKFQEAIPDSYRPDELTVPSVWSEKQGSYSEPHEGPSHDAHGAADGKDITKYPSKQEPVLEYRPESTSADSYVRPTSGDEPGISPDQGAESPTAAQATDSEDLRNEVFPAEKKLAPSDKDSVHSVQQTSPAETRKGETIVAAAEQTLPTISQQHTQDTREAPASDFVPAKYMPSDPRTGRPDEVPLVEQKIVSSDQDTPLTSSVEPRNKETTNSTRSAQPLFSAADDQTKVPQKTTIGQQDVTPTPGTSKSPSSDTHDASGQLQEVAPDDHHTAESLPSQGQVSHAKPSFVSEGPTRDSHSDVDKKITKLPSSQAQSSDPKSDPTQNRSDESPTRFLPSQLPKQRAETQALPPLVGPYDSKSSQVVTSDTLGKAKSPKASSMDQEATGSALTPDTNLGSAPREVASTGQKLLLKDQDSAHPTQKSSSSEPTKEESTVTAPNEAKTSPTIFSQQDTALAQSKMKDPSSGSQYVPQRLQKITPEDQRITGSIPMQQEVPRFEQVSKPHDGPTPDPHGAFVEEPMADTAGSIPNAQYGMAPSGLSPDEEKSEISDHPTQLRSSAGSRKEEGDVDPSDQTIMPAPGTSESSGEVLEVGPGNHRSKPLPVVELRKESTGAEDESKVYQPVTGQKDIRHAPGISEHVLDDDDKKEPVSREEQVSHDQRASEPREGSSPDVHEASLDRKTTPPSSQAQSSDTKRDALPKSVDVNPSSGQQSTTRLLRGQGAQLPALTRSPPLHESVPYPESNEDVPESFKPPSANQEVTSPKVVPASAPDTILGTASDEIAPDGQNLPLPARDLARSAQRPLSVEPTNEKGIAASSDQTSEARTIIGQRGVTPSTDKVKTPFGLPASELVKPPNENQEQVYARSAYEQSEGPSPVAPSAVDKKMPHPSSQAENSDIAPDSAPISGDAHRTSVDGPTTSSFRVSEAQPPTGTQNIPARFLEKIESPTPPSTDQELMTPMTSPAPAPEAPQDEDLTTSQLSPSVVSRKDVADQTNVSQAGLREPATSDEPATSTLRDSLSQPPAGTLNVPAVFLEKIESPRRPSTDQEPMAPMTSPAPAPDTPQDEDSTQSPQFSPSVVSRKDVADANQTDIPQAGPRVSGSSDATLPSEKEFSPDASLSKSVKPLLPMTGTDPVQPPQEASFVYPAVGQPENSAGKRPLYEESVPLFSQKNLERTLPEEISKQQQQTDLSRTRSSKDDSIEASGITSPNILTTSGDVQPSPPKESMQAAQGSRNQQQAGQAVFQSTRDNEKQVEETEAQENRSYEPKKIRPDSAPISGDARPTSDDGPATSSLRDSREQPPAETLSVPAVFLENIESPTPPSTDQEPMASMTSPAPAPDAPQDKDSTQSPQLSPSPVSRKDVADADQTNVPQAGLREAGSSDARRPSEEFSPDAYLTKSAKPLLHMTDESLPKSVDVNPSSGQQSTTRAVRGQGAQRPALTRSPLLHESNEDVPESSANQEATSPKVVPASAPDTILGTASDEIAPDGQNFPLPARDLARSAQRSFSVEPTEEKGSSDQTSEARTIIDQREVTPSTDKREGPTPDAHGAADEKMPLPSSQAENSGIAPDSAPISGDAHRTSGDGPTTSSFRDSEAQPPTGTQNVPAVLLEKIESPTPPSTDQELMKPMTSPAPAPEAQQDQDLTTSQLSPSVVSRKDVADETSVSQAGLRESASSDSTRPSEKMLSPDSYLTKSEKTLLPMKGADPVQTPYEASLDLSSDEKTTMIKGDQANTMSNVSLSASQAVGQPGNSAGEGPLSEESVSPFSQKNLERTSPEAKSKQQQSSTRSSKDDSIEARGTANPNILTRSGDILQSPAKESMQEVQGPRNQQQADQAVFQSRQDNEKQIQETEAQDNGSDGPEEIRPDSASISGTSSDAPATSSLRYSPSQAPAGTLDVPPVFLEKIEPTPRRPSTDQELMTSPEPAPDTPQDEDSTQSGQLSRSVVSRKGIADANQTDVPEAGLRVAGSSDATLPSEKIQEFSPDASLNKSAKPLLPMTGTEPVQPPQEASFVYPAVGQSENSAVKRLPSEESVSLGSQKNLEGTLPEEKSKKQQQTDQSSTRSSNDDSLEASGTENTNIKTTGDLQPSPLKESMHATEGSRNQEQADQVVFQSTQDNRKQIQENEAQDSGSDGPEKIRPDSAPIGGDARRTSGDGIATSSLRDSQEQPPAGTLNVPAVFLENIESPRPPSTDQEPMTSKTSPAPAPDAPQDQESTQSQQFSPSVVSRKDVDDGNQTDVQQAGPRVPGSSDATLPSERIQEFSPDASPSVVSRKGVANADQASQAVGPSENSAVKGPLSEDVVSPFSQKSLKGTSPEEKPKQQKQTDQSNTRSPKDDSIVEARGTTSPDVSTSGDIQPSPLKESTQAAEGSRNQQQADQDVFQSTTLDNENQFVETEAQDVGPDELAEMNLQQNMTQKNDGASQPDALEQPGELVPAVQPRSNNTDIGSKPTEDAPGIVRADNKSESSLITSEESKQQVETEGKTQGGETKAPSVSEAELPEERDLLSRNKGTASQSQAETPYKSQEQTSSGIQGSEANSSKFDGSTDDAKSADTDENPPSP